VAERLNAPVLKDVVQTELAQEQNLWNPLCCNGLRVMQSLAYLDGIVFGKHAVSKK
jgi:hypothetical protein